MMNIHHPLIVVFRTNPYNTKHRLAKIIINDSGKPTFKEEIIEQLGNTLFIRDMLRWYNYMDLIYTKLW